jgi:signal transduction histidine kinase
VPAADPNPRSESTHANAQLPPVGMTAASLRAALHDLRGPLNTLSVLLEILRAREVSTPAGLEVVDKATQAVRGLGHMLERLGRVTATLPAQRSAVPMLAQLQEAAARAGGRVRCTLAAPTCDPADAAVWGCASSFAALLDSLCDCVAAALPQGGSVELQGSATADACVIRVRCVGEGMALPAAFARSKLDGARPAAADWFRLSCQVSGLAGEFVGDGSDPVGTITMRFPRAR